MSELRARILRSVDALAIAYKNCEKSVPLFAETYNIESFSILISSRKSLSYDGQGCNFNCIQYNYIGVHTIANDTVF